ncbi:subclass B3 metallo-beta-lactamase [Novosphingobium flavum]|uniref:Subclass B3 metallo-beta-lactamase n=1 Tax=Novosphingobium flavum TaxID=1778672 RepID=A0A7X1FSI3_9SPHN|nr:subclass B3 metallo-beta-lactamase [Novosphingobium flavum]MBC2666145.1 subclass B3 metallo-beta-lactamase [Novosphingobium flavum]
MSFRTAIRCLAASALLTAALAPAPITAATTQTDPQVGPFRIAGNLYYVGGLHGSYLVKTAKGLILINSNYPDSPPLIRQSVEKLGFKWKDIKVLLISHSHVDHAGGSAQIVRETGAKYEVMAGDVDTIETGGKADFYYGADTAQYYPPAKVDRVLHDGDKVSLGGMTLTARLTPGHTKGTTTWTFDVRDGGKTLHVVVIGGSTLNRDVNLIDNPKYPGVADDYRKGFAVLRSLPCDIPLGSHDWYFDLQAKVKRLEAGDKAAFIDPKGCAAFTDRSEKAFNDLLAREKQLVAEGKPAGK